MKVLLAVDTSDASEIAVREVAARPWPAGTIVEVLGVVEPSHVWSIGSLVAGIREALSDDIRTAADALRAAGIDANTQVLCGDPKAVVIDQAAALDADLVVVGSHEASDVVRFILGSVARAAVRFAPCSVEVVRPRNSTGGLKVLLATDGSACSEAAARSIAERPWPVGTEIRILSVVELEAAWFRNPYPPYFDPKEMEDLREKAMRRAQEAVMAAELIVTNAGLPTSGTVAVPSASYKEVILNEATQWGADLIVIGSHGRRAASRFLIGSVSEAVALHANCSVEIIRQRRA
jgi:nucleotide-binding universal stress UspA family protein